VAALFKAKDDKSIPIKVEQNSKDFMRQYVF
jgi:hypothetical protein